jgi:dihydrofolate reductase
VSVTRDWGIGKDNRLVVHNKADMRFFREMTTSGTIIMGRATQQTLPKGYLPNRRNIVLTTSPLSNDHIIPVASVDALLDTIKDDDPDKTWVIGGQSVYEQLLPICDHAYVTFNANYADECDRFFPDLEANENWSRDRVLKIGKNEDGFYYATYLFRNKLRKKWPDPQDWKPVPVVKRPTPQQFERPWYKQAPFPLRPEKNPKKSLDSENRHMIYSSGTETSQTEKA